MGSVQHYAECTDDSGDAIPGHLAAALHSSSLALLGNSRAWTHIQAAQQRAKAAPSIVQRTGEDGRGGG